MTKQEWVGANSIKIVPLTDEQRDYFENGVITPNPKYMGEAISFEELRNTALTPETDEESK